MVKWKRPNNGLIRRDNKTTFLRKTSIIRAEIAVIITAIGKILLVRKGFEFYLILLFSPFLTYELSN